MCYSKPYKILSNTFHPHHAAAPGLMDIKIDGLFSSTHTTDHPYKLNRARCAKTVRHNFLHAELSTYGTLYPLQCVSTPLSALNIY